MSSGERRTGQRYPASSGFWTWDIKRNVVFGDATLAEYFGFTMEQTAAGIGIEAYQKAMHLDDSPRVIAAIQRSVAMAADFNETYRVHTKTQGVRRIMAVGKCYYDENGEPATFPGWFVDVTEGEMSSTTALRISANLIERALYAVRASNDDFLIYLMTNLEIEVARRLANPGLFGRH